MNPILLIFATILYIPAAIVRGFVVSQMWLWFVVPVFGLPLLPVIPAVGVTLLVSVLTHETSTTAKDGTDVLGIMVSSIANSLIYLFFGFIWSQFV